MMYAWEENRERCYQLYVTEGKSMDEVMELMRLQHDFAPRYVSIGVTAILRFLAFRTETSMSPDARPSTLRLSTKTDDEAVRYLLPIAIITFRAAPGSVAA